MLLKLIKLLNGITQIDSFFLLFYKVSPSSLLRVSIAGAGGSAPVRAQCHLDHYLRLLALLHHLTSTCPNFAVYEEYKMREAIGEKSI